jgi:hypothetical protein
MPFFAFSGAHGERETAQNLAHVSDAGEIDIAAFKSFRRGGEVVRLGARQTRPLRAPPNMIGTSAAKERWPSPP